MKSNREIQTRFMTPFFGGKVDKISSMQVRPLDPHMLHKSSIGGNVKSSAILERALRTRRRMAFTVEETRRHYAIEALEKPGSFRPQPYLYTCVRCRWIFRLNDTRGSIIALDGLGRSLAEPENAKRIVTFHRGPCPAFPVLEYLVAEVERETRVPKFISKIADLLVGFVDRHTSRTPREQSPPAEITH